MAFNPFESFRKHQKFVMAGVLLISMVTFVLCSGVGNKGSEGELGEMILRAFRPRGEVYATFNGSNLYVEEVNKLRDQRNLANTFMTTAKKIALQRVENGIKEGKLEQKGKDILDAMRSAFEFQMRRKQHFEGGVKLQDVLDFKAWLAEADRLNITMPPQVVQSMVFAELLSAPDVRDPYHFNPNDYFAAQNDALAQYRQFGAQGLTKALGDEYRVRIAQLALAKVQPFQLQLESKEAGRIVFDAQPRALPTPEEMFQFYREKVSPQQVSMLPVRADAFLKGIEEPSEAQLTALFNEGRLSKYDPHSDKPGFEQPLRAKYAYVTADPDSAAYKSLAKTLIYARDFPVTAFSPAAPQAYLLRLAAGPALREAALQETYEQKLQNPSYRAPSLGSSNLPLHLALFYSFQRPETMATLTAGLADPSFGFAALPMIAAPDLKTNAAAIQSAVVVEAKRRVPAYATLVASSTSSPFTYLALNEAIEEDRSRPFLPLDIVRDKVEKVQERSIAIRYAVETIVDLRRKIEALPQQNNKAQLERALAPYIADNRVELKQTEKGYSRYEIANAKELEPLQKAFEKEVDRINIIEGRGMLSATGQINAPIEKGDFWKLFFDSSERFSVAGAPYGPKPFPPDLSPAQAYIRNKAAFEQNAMMRGFDPALTQSVVTVLERNDESQLRIPTIAFAEKPFLLWKVEEQRPYFPETLAEAKDQVTQAWKLIRARDLKALPFAEKIARELIAGNQQLIKTRLDQEAAQLGAKTATLGVADYTPGPAGSLEPFRLQKGLLDDPRDDIANHILAVIDLKKPLEYGIPAVDALNKSLYDVVSTREKEPRGKFVQIIPNKPRTVYYVVASQPAESFGEQFAAFRESMSRLPFMAQFARQNGGQGLPRELTTRAMESEGKEVYDAILDQLRKNYRVKIEASEKTRSTFDADNTGGGGA
ncbi:MAG: hypothetical protein K2X38_24725 [Gemmataceae bacterium]|nr:hypothetical protein [Gemmataceae bacterium]